MIQVPRTPCFHGFDSINKCKVCQSDWRKRYRAANLEAYRERNRSDRKVYYKKNRYAVLVDTLNRRAKKYGAAGILTAAFYESLVQGPCAYCNQVGLPMELDHRIPLSQGGSNYPDNCQAVCRYCNKAKHWYGEEDFLDWLNKLRKAS